MNIKEKIQAYQTLKHSKKEIESLFDSKIKPIKDAMKKLELEMLDFLNQHGQDSAKTEAGTIYKSTLKSITVSDGLLLYDFIRCNDAIDLLQRKINKTTYEQYIEDGIDIPGIEVNSRITLNIRKK